MAPTTTVGAQETASAYAAPMASTASTLARYLTRPRYAHMQDIGMFYLLLDRLSNLCHAPAW